MTMRLIKLPADLAPLAEMLGQTFQYPENEAWSVQTDEKEQLVDAIANLCRIWPPIHLIQALLPSPLIYGTIMVHVVSFRPLQWSGC